MEARFEFAECIQCKLDSRLSLIVWLCWTVFRHMAPKLTAQRRLQGASTQMCSSICVSVLTRMFAVLFLLRFPARKPRESVEVQKLFSKEPLHAHSAPSLPPSPANGQLRLMRSCLGQGVGCHGLPPTANPTDEHYCLVVKHMFNVSLAVENQLSVT